MTRFLFLRRHAAGWAAAALAGCLALPLAAQAQSAAPPSTAGDYIVAVVDQELVTHSEVQQRLARVEQDAARNGTRLPPRDQLRRQIIDALIDERAQLSHAKIVGLRVDEAEIDRAVANVAAQNQLTLPQLRDRLREQGIDFARFRNNVRDELLLTRLREREVQRRIKVTDGEIDAYLRELRGNAGAKTEYDIAQVLISVPEGATPQQEAERRARAQEVLDKARAGAPFEELVRDHSEGPNREQGGRLGMRPADPPPPPVGVAGANADELAAHPLRSGAGFHVLKLADRKDREGMAITQTRARHILLRVSPQLTQQTALRRLADYKQRIERGEAGFAQLAREVSEDGSAPQGGDLGWANPGQFVPEFEQVMNQLAVGKISEPFVSRFGVHLVQVTERRDSQLDARQQRELATNALRERKFDQAYEEWAREIRAQAYVEMREPPQ